MIRLLVLIVLIFTRMTSIAQTSFNTTFGGDGFDRGMYLAHTSANGYILCGYTKSFGDNYDMYVVKSDEHGQSAMAEKLWWK